MEQDEVITISAEMMKRHDMAQKAAQIIMDALEGLTVVEGLGVLELSKSGLLRYAEVPEYNEVAH